MVLAIVAFVMMIIFGGVYFAINFRKLYKEDKKFFLYVFIPTVSGGVILFVSIVVLLIAQVIT